MVILCWVATVGFHERGTPTEESQSVIEGIALSALQRSPSHIVRPAEEGPIAPDKVQRPRPPCPDDGIAQDGPPTKVGARILKPNQCRRRPLGIILLVGVGIHLDAGLQGGPDDGRIQQAGGRLGGVAGIPRPQLGPPLPRDESIALADVGIDLLQSEAVGPIVLVLARSQNRRTVDVDLLPVAHATRSSASATAPTTKVNGSRCDEGRPDDIHVLVGAVRPTQAPQRRRRTCRGRRWRSPRTRIW
mmetsp:Transcript_29387/g.68827  ORF Transcript_29387/g.68827 Transcript_29387/m.68827 type:complete len:246 (-) Transcript_29387:101-838(-)